MNTLVVMSSASTESFEAFDTGESKYFSSVLSPEDFDNADAL